MTQYVLRRCAEIRKAVLENPNAMHNISRQHNIYFLFQREAITSKSWPGSHSEYQQERGKLKT